MTDITAALNQLRPNSSFGTRGDKIIWNDTENSQPSEEEINAKIQELQAAEPLRLLRIERTRLLQETDWEMTRILETQDKTSMAYINLNTYREALRNLPQEIEAGNIEAPTLDEAGNLVFTGWPERVME